MHVQSRRGHNASILPHPISRPTQSRSSEREIELVTNAYSLISSKTNAKIFEYELRVTPSEKCSDLPAKVLSRTYVSRSIRKLIMASIVPQITAPNQPIGSILIEPNLEIIFSTRQFEDRSSSLTEQQPSEPEFKFENLAVETDLITNLHIDIFIKFSRSYESNPKSYSAVLLSSILHHQLQIDMLRYGSVYYFMHGSKNQFGVRNYDYGSQSDRLDLISQHLIGVSISGARRGDDNQSLVVINCSHSYITKSYRLIDLLASFIASKPVDNVILLHSLSESHENLLRSKIHEINSICGLEDWFQAFCSILDGFKCHAIDHEHRHINFRFSLTDGPATKMLINANLNVQQFYHQIGINLNYPNLPCLKTRSTELPYIPFEMCSLLSGQKVPMFRLSTVARNHLTRVNKPKPNFTRQSSSVAKQEIVALNKNQFRAFGIELSNCPVETIGRTLARPTLQYKNVCFEPEKDFWESDIFCETVDLIDNWCIVDTTTELNSSQIMKFFSDFSASSKRYGFKIGQPILTRRLKQDILDQKISMRTIINDCNSKTKKKLRFILFIIDSTSTPVNRMIHLTFDEHPSIDATCIRAESIQNQRQQRSIYRTLVHKLNSRLGGTNVSYHKETMDRLGLDTLSGLMVVGLDVTHPDNELNGVSIVGCAYTLSNDLFRHRSLVWPQTARVEIINKMDTLMLRLLHEYKSENNGRLPAHVIVYRDGVSHEEFERVRNIEITKVLAVIDEQTNITKQGKPILSFVIAQKRHTLRFFQQTSNNQINNPPCGTLISQGVVPANNCEFYLYSNTSPQATARPLHYHVLVDGLGLERLQKLTYYLCFNFGKCSSSLSMPSSLRYAHNAAYDARNRVIASKEFKKNKFYATKFFC